MAEELHFTRAAQRLHLAQQALSQQIRQLEQELDAQLFVRTTRSVELTDAGRALHEHASQILGSVEAAAQHTRSVAHGELGRLTIAYTPTVAHEALPLITEAIHARLPNLTLRSLEMWQAEVVAGVEGGRFDLGMARLPTLAPGLESEVVRVEEIGVILGVGHELARAEAVAARDLSPYVLMIWPREFSPGYYGLVVDRLAEQGFTGRVREFENLTPSTLFGDDAARMEVAALRAFAVGFATQPLSEGYVWRPLADPPLIPLDLVWKTPAAAAVENVRSLIRALARHERWGAG